MSVYTCIKQKIHCCVSESMHRDLQSTLFFVAEIGYKKCVMLVLRKVGVVFGGIGLD